MINDKFFGDEQVVKTRMSVDERQNTSIVGLEEVAGVELVIDEQPEPKQTVNHEPDEPKRKPTGKRGRAKPPVEPTSTQPTIGKDRVLTDDELRIEILNEMIDRTRRQIISKELDIQLYQKLYNEALNTNMRERCERIYTAAINERREIQLKLKILIEMKR